MIRVIEMIATFVGVLVGLLVLGAVGIGVWVTYGHVGLAALGVLGMAVALAWAAAERVGEAARRQAALQVQRQAAPQAPRREPRLAVPPQSREGRQYTDDDVTIIEWSVPAREPTSREPRLFRDADDFKTIEWTEDRTR